MSDRLTELQRHRAMLQEQLAWLDREIAALGGTKPSALPPTEGIPRPVEPARVATPAISPLTSIRPTVPSPVAPLASAKSADEIMAQYQTDTGSVQSKTRWGCFLYFFLALAMVAAVVLILYIRTLRR